MPINKQPEDLTGRKFERWTVTGYAGYKNRHLWNVLCECGNARVVGSYQLVKGKSKSCGCFARDANREKNIVHGETANGKRSPEFRAFNLAKNQCSNPAHENYAKFGKAGIKFLFDSFDEFLKTVGRRPGAKYVLTRIDSAGHYAPGNLKWTLNKNRLIK